MIVEQSPNTTPKPKYGLFTAFSMIMGIVIGSGIFFKSDNILQATNGNILLGVLIFCLAAFGIIFGSLTFAHIAHQTQEPGGIIIYAKILTNPTVAHGFGLFFMFIYLPALIAVISWVAIIYLGMLFGFSISPLAHFWLCFALNTIIFLLNTFSYKLASLLQNFATIIKLIPLLVIGIAGFILGNPQDLLVAPPHHTATTSLGWLGAIAPIAFAFDGWTVATSITHEIKNSKKNLPIALSLSSIFILLLYVGYFVGISILVGPQNIIELGDKHVETAAILLLGAKGSKIILLFVVISILGTLNGLILGSCNLPYTLAVNNMLPQAKKIGKINPTLGISTLSVLISFVISSCFLIWHYYNQTNPKMFGNDISEIAVSTSYILYIILYARIIYTHRHSNTTGLVWRLIFPLLAIIGATTIISGGLHSRFFWVDNLITIAIIIVGISYKKLKPHQFEFKA